jgi:hypothetical protein
MEWRDLIIDGYGRVVEGLEHTLGGVSRADLDKQPKEDCNSMGWLAWHLVRGQDAQIADLMGAEQLWLSEGWHAKFGRPADPRDTGFGHTPEQVAAFRSPEPQVFIDYARACTDRTKSYLAQLTPFELSRELDEPQWQPLPTVGVRLVSILDDELLHVGQIGYVRGLLKGKGWQPY